MKNCYAALGVIHNEWHPIPGRIKDFIAIPRPNLYQSLHTSVMGPGGVAFEVQIRTEEMHRLAEEGIAAHWKYKEGKKGAGDDDQRIAWLRQLVEWQREMRDPADFMSNLKVDLYPEEVYCFTPQGRVVVLPARRHAGRFRLRHPHRRRPHLHRRQGERPHGAAQAPAAQRRHRRDPHAVQLATPSRDWLTFVKTARARNKIRHVINAERTREGDRPRPEAARARGPALRRRPEPHHACADGSGRRRVRLLARSKTCTRRSATGKFSARQVLTKLAPDPRRSNPRRRRPPASGSSDQPHRQIPARTYVILVKGVDDLLTYRAKCCNPIRGEPIVGYITRGKGVAVHSRNCSERPEPDVRGRAPHRGRMGARRRTRASTSGWSFNTDDRTGMLNQLTQILFDEEVNIRSVEARAERPARRRRHRRNDHRSARQEAARTHHLRHAPRLRRPRHRARPLAHAAIYSTDPLHIAVSKSKGINIDWSDGHISRFTCALLATSAPAPPAPARTALSRSRATTPPPPRTPLPIHSPCSSRRSRWTQSRRSALTPSASTGTTPTTPASIRSLTCARCARALTVYLARQQGRLAVSM